MFVRLKEILAGTIPVDVKQGKDDRDTGMRNFKTRWINRKGVRAVKWVMGSL